MNKKRPAILLLVLIAFAALIAILVLLPKQCSEPIVEPGLSNTDTIELSSNRLEDTELTLKTPAAVAISERSSRIGIDVSEHQGQIDWPAVKAGGIEFAILRIGGRGYTAGSIFPDKYFEENFQGAVAAGIPVGVYFFSQAINEDEALAEAEYVIEQLAGRKLSYPVVYDLEPVADAGGRANGLSYTTWEHNAEVFCACVEQAGYTAMIYGNAKDLAHYKPDLLARYQVWFAEYHVNKPSLPYHLDFWQFASYGLVAGIQGAVDLNIEYLTEDHTEGATYYTSPVQ